MAEIKKDSKEIKERNVVRYEYIKYIQLLSLKDLQLIMKNFGLKKGNEEYMRNKLILIYDEARKINSK